MGKKRAQSITWMMRMFIGALGLDIEHKRDDLVLAQFHTYLFGDALSVLSEWASSNRSFGFSEGSKLAEFFARSHRTILLWRGPPTAQIQATLQFMGKVVSLLIKQEFKVAV